MTISRVFSQCQPKRRSRPLNDIKHEQVISPSPFVQCKYPLNKVKELISLCNMLYGEKLLWFVTNGGRFFQIDYLLSIADMGPDPELNTDKDDLKETTEQTVPQDR